MQVYQNLDRDSGVVAYEIGADFITVKFKQGRFTTYKYTYGSAGVAVVESMKVLAKAGRGLNSFIGHNKPQFASKTA